MSEWFGGEHRAKNRWTKRGRIIWALKLDLQPAVLSSNQYQFQTDYSVLQIRDVDSGEQVARIRGRIAEGPFGEMVYAALRWYNNAFLVPEVKGGYGRPMLNKLLELGYPEDLIWNRHMYSEIAGQPRHQGKIAYHDLGWNTGETNRPTMIAFLDDAITGHTIETYDELTIQEYRHFCYGPRKVEAEAGWHDDLVIADCLCCVGIWLVHKGGQDPPAHQ